MKLKEIDMGDGSKMIVSEFIKYVMEKRYWTKADLASKVGVSERKVIGWLNGGPLDLTVLILINLLFKELRNNLNKS